MHYKYMRRPPFVGAVPTGGPLGTMMYTLYMFDDIKGGIIMCVGLPARVMKIQNGMALVDASGAKREVSAALIDELNPGDYVMVHAGMAIAKITDNDADETDDILEDLN
jgi:hydrogenase expression/formation protein HypC